MSRVKSFSAPHKGLRSILSRFSFLAGKTNYHDPHQVELLQNLGKEMFTLLNNHVHTENEYVLKPLEQKSKGASAHDLHDHEELEKVQDRLEDAMNSLDGSQNPDQGYRFYLEFTDFHSMYLAHIYHEETVTEKLLQENYTDIELNLRRMETMGRMPFDILLLWFKYIIPAMNETESLTIFTQFRENAPRDVFEFVLEGIKSEIDEKSFNILSSSLKA